MAHKTLIGGTAYEISGGKTLVNGTAYSIDKGKTLVDGTVYEVGFSRDPVITIQKTGTKDPYSGNSTSVDASYANVMINDVVYDGSSEVELTIPAGTVIHCYAKRDGTSAYAGVSIHTDEGNTSIQYPSGSGSSINHVYTANKNASILISKSYMSYTRTYHGSITITEQ